MNGIGSEVGWTPSEAVYRLSLTASNRDGLVCRQDDTPHQDVVNGGSLELFLEELLCHDGTAIQGKYTEILSLSHKNQLSMRRGVCVCVF